MGLILLIVILVLVGFALWAINKYVPMQAGMKTLLNAAVIIFMIVFLLQQFGLLSFLNIHVGK